MRHAAPVRRELAARTVFNVLGPLTNPAGARAQVVGVYAPELVPTIARVLAHLGARRAFVVHGAGGIDELSPTGPNLVCEVVGGRVRKREIDPLELGVPRCDPAELRGGSPDENAARIRAIFAGANGGARDAVLLNAAGAIARRGPREGPARGPRARPRGDRLGGCGSASRGAGRVHARGGGGMRFRDALAGPGLSAIAEIKRRSPSAGDLRPDADPVQLSRQLETAGAAAISVLVDHRFGGSTDDLAAARAATRLPLLAKGFFRHPGELEELKKLGADAVLLLLRDLDDRAAARLMAAARELGLDALVEAHSAEELDRAIEPRRRPDRDQRPRPLHVPDRPQGPARPRGQGDFATDCY